MIRLLINQSTKQWPTAVKGNIPIILWSIIVLLDHNKFTEECMSTITTKHTVTFYLMLLLMSIIFFLPIEAHARGGHGGGHHGGWGHGGWGHGGWGHRGGWGNYGGWHRGWGYGGVGLIGIPTVGYYGGACRWVAPHWNAYGRWVPAYRACW